MRCLIDTTTDPYYNIAAEEYLLTQCIEPIFRLWSNSSSIIVGRNQNTKAEINIDHVRLHQIPVVRRMSGGGAVFHDLGNINFTFIDQRIIGEDTFAMFRRFTAPIIKALREIGVQAYIEGRNDLLIDGRKFSGNAVYSHQDRVLQHGTLLFSSSIADLSAALNTRAEKFVGKGVKSNISRVTNISDHLPPTIKDQINSPQSFMEYIKDFIMAQSAEYTLSSYTEEEIGGISALRDKKYQTNDWNYGKSPKYQYSNTIKLNCGFIEVHLEIKAAIITSCQIQGDYFFLKPTQDIENALTNIPHQAEDISQALSHFDLSEYFGADITEELSSLLRIV